jgi:ribosomal protein L15
VRRRADKRWRRWAGSRGRGRARARGPRAPKGEAAVIDLAQYGFFKLLGKGEIKSALNLTVYAATPSAIAAVEKAGGTVTVTRPVKAEAEA